MRPMCRSHIFDQLGRVAALCDALGLGDVTVDTPLGQQSAQDVGACQHLCRTDPQFWAASLSLKTPERSMALWMVMTVGVFVYAALEYRLRKALTDHAATVPTQQGQAVQNPPARWILHSGVGMHRLLRPGHWPHVLNRTEAHLHLLHLLGQPYGRFDSSLFTNMRGAMRNVSYTTYWLANTLRASSFLLRLVSWASITVFLIKACPTKSCTKRRCAPAMECLRRVMRSRDYFSSKSERWSRQTSETRNLRRRLPPGFGCRCFW